MENTGIKVSLTWPGEEPRTWSVPLDTEIKIGYLVINPKTGVSYRSTFTANPVFSDRTFRCLEPWDGK